MRMKLSIVFLFLSNIAFGQIEVVVHRGANKLAPENTRASAQAAIDLGAHYVEIDVRTSKDDVLYIIHDGLVNRTTNGFGTIASMSSAAVDKLDAGSWFDKRFAGERVPKLREYLQWIKGKAKVYLDVKDADAEQLIQLVKETGMEEDCFFWSWKKKWVKEFRQLSATLPLKVNAHSVRAVEKAVKAFSPQIIECGVGDLTPEFVKACRQHNLKIMLYGGKEDEAYFRKVFESEGVDMVNIDKPELYFEVLKSQ